MVLIYRGLTYLPSVGRADDKRRLSSFDLWAGGALALNLALSVVTFAGAAQAGYFNDALTYWCVISFFGGLIFGIHLMGKARE
jgi:amino acid transporter